MTRTLSALVLLAFTAAAAPPRLPAADVIPVALEAFQRDVSPALVAVLKMEPRHWRQLEPAVHHLATQHADRLAALSDTDRTATLVALTRFIDRVRTAAADHPVLAEGRTVVGLLDPARGLDPREITTIADAYGAAAVTFKQDPARDTLAQVAAAFLAAVRDKAGGPTSLVVLGHGLPEEIQSYHIPFGHLAEALLDATGTDGPVDLGGTVVICDDCYSADFLINLYAALETGCRDRGRPLASLPAGIAGTNRSCVGHADVGEKFVPHFWKDVIELCYVRRPRPHAVTLRSFFDGVDNMMYGYGRAPIVEGAKVVGYRLVDPELVQDPVVFVPLGDDDLAELRRILGLAADAPLPRWLDIG